MRPIQFLAVLVLVLSATTVQAQDTASTAARPAPPVFGSRKSVTTARLLAIVPSAGHFYAGERGRGLAVLGGMAGVLLIGTLAVVGDCIADYGPGGDQCENDARDTAITVAFYGIWGWSIYDAGSAARRTNTRRGFSGALMVAPARVSAADFGRTMGMNVGITLHTR